MNDKIIKLLSDKPIVIPRILFNNYRKLNITEEELLIVILIISYGNVLEYNPDIFIQELNFDKHKVMSLITSLIEKNIVSLEIVKTNNKTSENLSVSCLYDKLLNIILDNDMSKLEVDKSLFTTFESELGRLLSPMEIEQIKEWMNTYENEELITSALKEAVLNGVNNFRYIDAILIDWKKKGYKTKNDIIRDHNTYHKMKKSTPVYDTDWLNDDE